MELRQLSKNLSIVMVLFLLVACGDKKNLRPPFGQGQEGQQTPVPPQNPGTQPPPPSSQPPTLPPVVDEPPIVVEPLPPIIDDPVTPPPVTPPPVTPPPVTPPPVTPPPVTPPPVTPPPVTPPPVTPPPVQYEEKKQNFTIEQNKKVDVLFVIDNSKSMAEKQKNMAQRIDRFMDQVKNLQWRIGVVTTEPKASKGGDGQLLKMNGTKNYYLDYTNYNLVEAQKILGQTLQRPEVGSSDEQGLFVTYRSIERALNNESTTNKVFFRSDAHLAVVLLSDEDESAQQPKNSPENLLQFVKTNWTQKNFVFHSIITRPRDHACLKAQSGAKFGFNYARMTELTGINSIGGAILGNICSQDYGTQLSGLGDSVKNMHKVFMLQCKPVINPSSKVTVYYNEQIFQENYLLIDDRLQFEKPLPEGQFRVEYTCEK